MKGAFIAVTASLLFAPAAIAHHEINPQGEIERTVTKGFEGRPNAAEMTKS